MLYLLNYRWVHEFDESMMLQPLMMLRLVNEFVMTYDIDLNNHNIHTLINDMECE